MSPEPAELLARAGASPGSAITGELAHNQWLSLGVWEVRTGTGQRAVFDKKRT